jgi:flagellar basal body-associated protein FliL
MMTQPPQSGPDPLGGHPEPEPVPLPDPDPPLPIPPPDPIPPPEPPHAATTTDFIDRDPPVSPVEWPPIGAYPGEAGYVETPVADEPASAQPTAPLDPLPAERTAPLQPAGSPQGGWRQPPPTSPWHAQQEKPGKWRYQPPEHLAWQHSPPAGMGPEPTEPIWTGAQAPPWQVPLAPPAEKRRGGLWVSLALTLILLLCGGGAVSAFVLISNADTGKGAPDPATAVNRFMTAIYTQQDADVAGELVCRQARDKTKLAARVNEIKNYANQYAGPTFRWTEPQVSGQTNERAVVTVQLTLSTDDEKQAQQKLTFTTIHKTGWLVCDVAG